jgi:glycosyltransferase involved in cell wall biosynthesis
MTTNPSPLVTVGVPVYNSERFLAHSLDSLLGQTYGDFILIISDNASTDGTAEICRRYVESDPRVRYYRNPMNIGNPGNFNRVCELTTTPYLKWSTADDYWAPTFLAKALEVMERDPSVVLCYPQAVFVDANGENPQNYDDVLNVVQDDPADRFRKLIVTILRVHQHLGLVRMSALRRTHLLGTHVSSDINLLAELALYGKFHELPERLFFRRFHKDSGSWRRGEPGLDSAAHDARTYYASGASGRVRYPKLRAYRWFFAAVETSPLPLASKLNLYWFLLRRMKWDGEALRTELQQAYQRPAGSGAKPR